MFEKLEILQMAQSMASQAALRQNAVATNIANANTPGYRARDVASFSDTYETEHRTAMRATRPGHISSAGSYRVEVTEDKAASSESPNGNTVSLEDEMVKSVQVRQQHDLALAIYKSSLGILRTSLGKG